MAKAAPESPQIFLRPGSEIFAVHVGAPGALLNNGMRPASKLVLSIAVSSGVYRAMVFETRPSMRRTCA